MSEQDILRIFANPFYCLSYIDETFVRNHEPMVTEEEFIEVATELIKEIGVEAYLRNLLFNLKGEYIVADTNLSNNAPIGYRDL